MRSTSFTGNFTDRPLKHRAECFGKQSSLTRAADHVEAAPISELHESTPHSFGSACFVDSRSVHMGAGACRPHLLCRRFAPAGVRGGLSPPPPPAPGAPRGGLGAPPFSKSPPPEEKVDFQPPPPGGGLI